jgi:hypothetical protein
MIGPPSGLSGDFAPAGDPTITWDGPCNEPMHSPAKVGGSYKAGFEGDARLRELMRTNDAVLLSAIGALLDGAGLDHLVLDQNMSILEGSIGVIPRRILVHADDLRAARQLLTDAGLAHELSRDA